MADHAHSPQQASAHSVNVAMGLCLILAAAGLVVAAMNAPQIGEVTEASFVVTPPQVDPQRLAADRAKHYPEVDLSAVAEPLEELYTVSRQVNELQFAEPDAKAAHENQILMAHAANDVITEIGIEGFIPAGVEMVEACSKEFEKLLAALRAGKITAEQARTDPGEAYAGYRANCGNAFVPLADSGIVTKDGQWVDPVSGPLVFDVMNRYRWATTLDLRRPPSEQLSPYEYEVFTRWRASIRSVAPGRRIQWVVSAGKTLPRFPTQELIGSLLLEQGDAVGALGAYEEACAAHKGDIELQRKCEFLRTHVQDPGAPSGDPHAATKH